jgi:selenocysteine lyase/cysteine desulfurase
MMNRRLFLGSAIGAALAARVRPATAAPLSEKPGWPPPVFQDDEQYWRTLRREFLIPGDEAFFNTGTLGSSPRIVGETVIDHMRLVDATIAHWDYKAGHPEYLTGYQPETEIRAKIAALVGASTEEIALTQNATVGMNYVANGLPLQPGDEIILTDQEHPGGRTGWDLKAKRYGSYVKNVRVPVPPQNPQQLIDLFVTASTPQTKVWAIPMLTSQLAIRFPVQELCRLARERGIFTVIDAAQICGHIHVDLHEMGCDAFYSSPHKWLLAPKGCGFLYVAARRLPGMWATLASSNWDNYRDGALRLMQIGTGNLSLLKGFDAAIEFHNRIGPERVQARIFSLADRLRAGLRQIPQVTIWSPQHAEMTSGTTVWSLAGYNATELMDGMWDRSKVRCRAMGDPYGVRQCCHIYNSPEEVDRTLATVREMIAARRNAR